MSMRTKSKGASASDANSSTEDDSQKPKTWFERWGYIVLLIVIGAIMFGGFGFWLIRRAYLKAIIVPVTDVTPAMLPVQVPNSTLSYFSLPDGVKNWNPQSAIAGQSQALAQSQVPTSAIGAGSGAMISDRAAPIGGGGAGGLVQNVSPYRSMSTTPSPTPPVTSNVASLNAAVAKSQFDAALRRGAPPPPIVAPQLRQQPNLAQVQPPMPPQPQPQPQLPRPISQPRVQAPVSAAGVAAPNLRAGFAQNFISNPDFI